MRFMFFGPEVCLGLPSDSASPRTPLPPTTATAAFTAQDLHLVDNAHAGHTKTSERSVWGDRLNNLRMKKEVYSSTTIFPRPATASSKWAFIKATLFSLS